MMRKDIVILGVFVADTSYRAERQPRIGETILGRSFALGPGGKGSNQAVATARAGGHAHFITRLGIDAFATMARETWAEAGVTAHVTEDPESYTGAAYIFIEDGTGDNAIIISPGAAGRISAGDVTERRELIGGASVLVTQLEQPLPAAEAALGMARAGGARTILNPAPATEVPQSMLALCDFVTPNETETEALTGVRVETLDDARAAAARFRAQGVGTTIITLGERGAYFDDGQTRDLVPAMTAGALVETTGAGDAFNGGFAAALAEDMAPIDAVRFGCATAAISVTRPGTAPSMPRRHEIDALLSGG